MLPTIALVCNVIVVSGGVWRFSRTGDLSLRRPMPFLAASVPAAWIGGRIPVSETVFIGLLGGALLLSVSHLAFQKGAETATVEPVAQSRNHRLFASGIGGAIGLLSGIVGIGGGIFLAPVLVAHAPLTLSSDRKAERLVVRPSSPRADFTACSVKIGLNRPGIVGG